MVTWIALFLFFAVAAFLILKPFIFGQTHQRRALRFATRADELKTALDAIDRDEAAGLVTPTEAERSRVRIAEDYEAYVANGDPSELKEGAANSHASLAAVSAVVVLAATAFVTYAVAGAPGFRDHPLDWRIENDPVVAIAHNVDRMEAYLAENPEDARAWAMVAPIYFEYGSWGKAANAYLSAAKYETFTNQEKSKLLVMATRAMLGEAEGMYTESSILVADAAARFDPQNIQARFLKADALAQGAPQAAAVAEWEAFLSAFPSDSSGFRAAAVDRLQSLRAKTEASSGDSVRGPTQQQMAAAAELSREEQDRMVEGMVSRLADRLAENPGDIEGWDRLIRSYVVMGRVSDAQAALERAQNSLKHDAALQSRLESLADELSLEP